MPETLRERIHEIIFEADTPLGKAFDVTLMVLIVISVTAVLLDSVEPIRAAYGLELDVIEWFFTIVFTFEYGLRLMSVRKPLKYAVSFFGIVDLLSILPTYLSLIIPSTESLLVMAQEAQTWRWYLCNMRSSYEVKNDMRKVKPS